jgi:hypothetical protein
MVRTTAAPSEWLSLSSPPPAATGCLFLDHRYICIDDFGVARFQPGLPNFPANLGHKIPELIHRDPTIQQHHN